MCVVDLCEGDYCVEVVVFGFWCMLLFCFGVMMLLCCDLCCNV